MAEFQAWERTLLLVSFACAGFGSLAWLAGGRWRFNWDLMFSGFVATFAWLAWRLEADAAGYTGRVFWVCALCMCAVWYAFRPMVDPSTIEPDDILDRLILDDRYAQELQASGEISEIGALRLRHLVLRYRAYDLSLADFRLLVRELLVTERAGRAA